MLFLNGIRFNHNIYCLWTGGCFNFSKWPNKLLLEESFKNPKAIALGFLLTNQLNILLSFNQVNYQLNLKEKTTN